MGEHNPTDEGPRSSPQTDPTNPHHQEAVGEFARRSPAS